MAGGAAPAEPPTGGSADPLQPGSGAGVGRDLDRSGLSVVGAAEGVAPDVGAMGAPASVSASPTATTTTIAGDGGAVDAPIASQLDAADAPIPAERGTSIQETPTLPPPPTEAPTTTVLAARAAVGTIIAYAAFSANDTSVLPWALAMMAGFGLKGFLTWR